jgi:hypothetical protein
MIGDHANQAGEHDHATPNRSRTPVNTLIT